MARFEPTRPSPWLLKVGHLHGAGIGTPEIAHIMNQAVREPSQAVSPASIRHMLQTADLPFYGFRTVPVRINFRSWERDFLQEHASDLKMPMEQMLYRFIKAGLVLAPANRSFSMYDSVVDGMFDAHDEISKEIER